MSIAYEKLVLNFLFPSDRFRTMINVMCDALGTIIVDHLSRQELNDLEEGEPHELLELRQEKE